MLACNEFLFKTITIMSIIRFIKNWTLPVAIAREHCPCFRP